MISPRPPYLVQMTLFEGPVGRRLADGWGQQTGMVDDIKGAAQRLVKHGAFLRHPDQRLEFLSRLNGRLPRRMRRI